MTADGPVSNWANDAVRFLSGNLPPSHDYEGWEHMFSSAYEIGCAALVALGQAVETRRGAVRRKRPALPRILPRWDDVCDAVLGLARQQGRLTYYLLDGTKPPEGFFLDGTWTTYVLVGRTTSPDTPNILATGALGPARATPEALSVLEALGLISGEHWTNEAETVLWRTQPKEWGMDIPNDPRFAEAVRTAVDSIPDDIRAEIKRLTTVSEKDVAAYLAQRTASYQDLRNGLRARPKANG